MKRLSRYLDARPALAVALGLLASFALLLVKRSLT